MTNAKTQRSRDATELREAFGVRGACSRFRMARRLTTALATSCTLHTSGGREQRASGSPSPPLEERVGERRPITIRDAAVRGDIPVAAPIYLACWLRTTTSSPWPSPPKEERETVSRPVSTEMRVRSRASWTHSKRFAWRFSHEALRSLRANRAIAVQSQTGRNAETQSNVHPPQSCYGGRAEKRREEEPSANLCESLRLGVESHLGLRASGFSGCQQS